MRKILLAATLAALLMAPTALGHAAPAPREYETRVLHDHNDDSAIVLAGQHGFDSIALDVREGRLPDGEPALILRLLLNGGCSDTAQGECGTLTQTVQFTGGDGAHEITFSTDDGGATWYGDAAQYVGPMGINDGNRFAIEGWLPMSSLGVATGSDISDWFVSATDNMPQGAVPGVPDPLDAAFDIGTYTVGEVDKYIALTAESLNLQAAPGDVIQVNFTVENLITESQMVELEIIGGTGPTTLQLAPNFADTLTVNATIGDADAIVVVARTALGGVAAAATTLDAVGGINEAAFSSPDVPAGSSWSHTFQTAGIFAYHNHHMAAVSGAVHINETRGNGTTHTVTWNGQSFEPSELHIQRGDTVVWQNQGDADMMVMGGVTADGSDPLAHDHDHHDHDTADEEAPGLGLVAFGLALLGAVVVARRR